MSYFSDQRAEELTVQESWVFHDADLNIVGAFTPYDRAIDLTNTPFVGDKTAYPEAVTRSPIAAFTPFDQGTVTFSFPDDSSFGQAMSRGEVRSAVYVSVLEFNSLGSGAIKWRGRIRQSRFSLKTVQITAEAVLHVEAAKATHAVSVGCPKSLYGPKCKAVEVLEPVTVIGGIPSRMSLPFVVTPVPGRQPAQFLGGSFVFPSGARKVIVRAEDSGGGNYDLYLSDLVGVTDPQGITTAEISLGCKKNTTDCNLLHNNIINFGGFDLIPEKDLYSK